MAAFDGDLGRLWTWERVLKRTSYFTFFFCIVLAGMMVIARPKLIVLYLRKFRKNTEVIDRPIKAVSVAIFESSHFMMEYFNQPTSRLSIDGCRTSSRFPLLPPH